MSAKAFVEYVHVAIHATENNFFDMYPHIIAGTLTGAHGLRRGRLYETPLYQLLHPIASDDVQRPHLAILGNGSEGDSHRGSENQVANLNVGLLDSAVIAFPDALHEKVVGVVGQADQTIGADGDSA